MKAMQPVSTRALIVTAAVILFAGFLVPSPSGAFLAFCLAALVAMPPAFFGAGKMRLVAAALLIGAVILAVGRYSAFRAEQQRHRERIKSARLIAPQTARAWREDVRVNF